MTTPQRHRARLLLPLIFLLLTPACTSIRPVVKIGLVAPFEGLYRRAGYEALDAMRQALDGNPTGAADLLPLALDNSRDPAHTARAVEKLAVDPAVQALIGPLTPAMTAALPADITDRFGVWIAPYAVDPAGGFADPRRDTAWATGLLAAIGAEARNQGAERIVLAGPAAGWPELTAAEWSAAVQMPVVLAPNRAEPRSTDALFWRGDAAAGAALLNTLRAGGSTSQFWLGPAGGDPVFAEHTTTFDDVYWSTWSDLEYNRWKLDRSPASPQAYLLFRATEAAHGQLSGEPISSQPWHVVLYAVDATGVSVPVTAE